MGRAESRLEPAMLPVEPWIRSSGELLPNQAFGRTAHVASLGVPPLNCCR